MPRGREAFLQSLSPVAKEFSPDAATRPQCTNHVDGQSCNEVLLFSPDAIGRSRWLCPRCDGVPVKRRPNPNDARVPQALVTPSAIERVEVLEARVRELESELAAARDPATRPAVRKLRCVMCGQRVAPRCETCGDPVPYAGHGRPARWCDKASCMPATVASRRRRSGGLLAYRKARRREHAA